MNRIPLTENQIEVGKLLVTKLDAFGLKIRAALWFYDSKQGSSWKLVIASSAPELDVKKDLSNARNNLNNIIQSIPGLSTLSTSDIELIPLDHPLIKNFKSAIETGPGIGGSLMENTQLNNLFIEAAYLYKMHLS